MTAGSFSSCNLQSRGSRWTSPMFVMVRSLNLLANTVASGILSPLNKNVLVLRCGACCYWSIMEVNRYLPLTQRYPEKIKCLEHNRFCVTFNWFLDSQEFTNPTSFISSWVGWFCDSQTREPTFLKKKSKRQVDMDYLRRWEKQTQGKQ